MCDGQQDAGPGRKIIPVTIHLSVPADIDIKALSRTLAHLHKGVTRVLQGCYEGVTRVLQWCYKVVKQY
jgi:hypothetical protein